MKLAQTFKTTVDLNETLSQFGDTVNNAMQFVLDIHEVEGNHCKFEIDTDSMTVMVEFISSVKLYNFAVKISYQNGFKEAKFIGTKLIPIVSNEDMIKQHQFTRIECQAGWTYLKTFVEAIDSHIIETDKKLSPPLEVQFSNGNKIEC